MSSLDARPPMRDVIDCLSLLILPVPCRGNRHSTRNVWGGRSVSSVAQWPSIVPLDVLTDDGPSVSRHTWNSWALISNWFRPPTMLHPLVPSHTCFLRSLWNPRCRFLLINYSTGPLNRSVARRNSRLVYDSMFMRLCLTTEYGVPGYVDEDPFRFDGTHSRWGSYTSSTWTTTILTQWLEDYT